MANEKEIESKVNPPAEENVTPAEEPVVKKNIFQKAADKVRKNPVIAGVGLGVGILGGMAIGKLLHGKKSSSTASYVEFGPDDEDDDDPVESVPEDSEE